MIPDHRKPSGPDPSARVALDILLVEDNPDVLDCFALALRLGGHQVTTAATLASALDAAASGRFALLISDIGLPDGCGLDLPRLAPDAFDAAICLSGADSEDDRLLSRALGFSEHLAKPVTVARLAQVIRRVMRPNAVAGSGQGR